MFCTKCGNQINDAKACPTCGTANTANDMPLLCACGFGFHALSGDTCPDCNRANPFKAVCEMCDRVVLADMDYCANCGTRLASASSLDLPEMTTMPSPAQKNNDPDDMNRVVCFCVNFVALALLLASAIMIYHGFTGSDEPVHYQIAIGAVGVLLSLNWIIHRIRS